MLSHKAIITLPLSDFNPLKLITNLPFCFGPSEEYVEMEKLNSKINEK